MSGGLSRGTRFGVGATIDPVVFSAPSRPRRRRIMFTRRAIGMLGASALVAAAAGAGAPAFAGGGGGDTQELRLTVCKVVKDKDKDKDKNKNDDKEKFRFVAETDRDDHEFKLRDGECRFIKLEFKRDKLVVEEKDSDKYKVSFKATGAGVDEWRSYKSTVTVDVNEKRKKPPIKIVVTNKKKDKKDHGAG